MSEPRPRILVTGASGYIGRALADEAARRGMDTVRCARQAPAGQGWVRLAALDAESVAGLPLDCDAVVHLAGIAHRAPSEQPPESEYIRVNAHGAEALAHAARGRARTFVLVSSIAAVGPGIHGTGAPATPRPASPYGRSKLAAEALVARALAGSTTSLRIVRLPAVHGPGAPGAIAQLAAWVGRGRPVPSACAGSRRSVIGIDNAVDFLIHAATDGRLHGLTVTPTDGPAPSVLEMARLIARIRGIGLRVIPCPRPALLAASLVAGAAGTRGAGLRQSLERLLESHVLEDAVPRTAAGWTPPVALEEGLRRALGGTA